MNLVRFAMPAILGMGLVFHGRADEQSAVPNPIQLESRLSISNVSTNQTLADEIARRVQASGKLRHYRLDVTCRDGHVMLQGEVADAYQRDQALRMVRGVPGVAAVHDQLVVRDTDAVSPAQAVNPQPMPPGPLLFPPNGQPAPTNPPEPPDLTQKPPEPTPIYASPHTHPHMFQAPRMPPYAWPTYAPYNNFSRVAYPKKYPYKSWPFIGPVYPFPKIPLGWRSVTLEWEDGFWWFRRNPTGHDWWRIRYW